jgi:hypothetical protein
MNTFGNANISFNAAGELLAFTLSVPGSLQKKTQRILDRPPLTDDELTKLAMSIPPDPDDHPDPVRSDQPLRHRPRVTCFPATRIGVAADAQAAGPVEAVYSTHDGQASAPCAASCRDDEGWRGRVSRQVSNPAPATTRPGSPQKRRGL